MNISKVIIAPSKKMADSAAKIYYKSKHKIKRIPWGLPSKEVLGDPLIEFKKNNSDEKQVNKKIKCVTLCKIIPQKGIDILLDSFYFIEKYDPIFAQKLELTICGDMSYMHDKGFKKIIEKKVERMKNKPKFPGWVAGEQKKDILTNSDLFLLTSLTEPFGFCVLEAMKAGLAIISFNTEGPSDIITNKFGRLVQLSDYDTMVKDFACNIIDVCQSGKLNEMKNSSAEAIKEWDTKKLVNYLI